MRALAREVSVEQCPPDVARFATPGQVFITAGREYEVFAMAVFEGVPILQIVDDLRYPAWLPAWLFEITEMALSPDWICNVGRDEPVLVIGPDFVAKDHAAYARMVELEANEVELFWRRFESRTTAATAQVESTVAPRGSLPAD